MRGAGGFKKVRGAGGFKKCGVREVSKGKKLGGIQAGLKVEGTLRNQVV